MMVGGCVRRSLFVTTSLCGSLQSSSSDPITSSPQIQHLLTSRRWRRPSSKTSQRAGERELDEEQSKRKEDVFEHTTSAAVGRPEEGQRGFLGLGAKRGRSMPLNPLLVLNKVEDPATKKVLLAVRKLKNNPETMQLSENEQQHVVNAYATTRWYARLWQPLKSLNYKSLRRWSYFASFLFTICFIGVMCCVIMLYRLELLAFQNLSDEEKAAYFAIVMHMRYSEVHRFGKALLKDTDPYEILPHEHRTQLVVQGMMKNGMHQHDWDQYQREHCKTTPWQEKDWIHLAFWAVMYFGRSVTGGTSFYPAEFGDTELVAQASRQKAADEMLMSAEHGPAVNPKLAQDSSKSK